MHMLLLVGLILLVGLATAFQRVLRPRHLGLGVYSMRDYQGALRTEMRLNGVSGPSSDRAQWIWKLSGVLSLVGKGGALLGMGEIVKAKPAVAAAADEAQLVALKNAEITNTMQASRKLLSDEFEIDFEGGSLGIGLQENGSKGFPVTTVNKIVDESLLMKFPDLREGAIVTQVASKPVDGKPLRDIAAAGPRSNWPKAILTKSKDRKFVALPGPPPVKTNGSV